MNIKNLCALPLYAIIIGGVLFGIYHREHPQGCALVQKQAEELCMEKARSYWFDNHQWRDGPFDENLYFKECYDLAVKATVECVKKTGEPEEELPNWMRKYDK